MNCALDTARTPWVSSPYSLHSWWDVQKFSAAGFIELMNDLANLPFFPKDTPKDYLISAEVCQSFEIVFQLLRNHCDEIGLTVSVNCVDGIVAELPMQPGMSLAYFEERCRHLEDVIRLEMGAVHFFHMDGKLVSFYNQKNLFGIKVSVSFPEMQYDITEAGNCYAMGRSTACVFHLMRIMEIGVQKFGDKLDVRFTNNKDWHNIIDEVNKAIKLLPQKNPETVALSQTAAHLHNVKVAWRNRVMHPHDTYTLEEAGDILNHTKAFMNSLASLLYPDSSHTSPVPV
jgi:hypothetical protein